MEEIKRIPLQQWLLDMEEIGGQWDGDESGLAEDRAHAASDAIEHIKELNSIFDFLDYN